MPLPFASSGLAPSGTGGKGTRIIGDKEMLRKLQRLGGPGARRVVRNAVSAGLTPINKAAKAKYPKDAIRTGQLRKSIGKKLGKFNKAKSRITGVVGARSGFDTGIVGSDLSRGIRIDPRYYAHLVEFGTRRTKAKPFLRPAFDSQQGHVKQVMAQKVREGIAKEARRKG